jgi:hypothetical protein
MLKRRQICGEVRLALFTTLWLWLMLAVLGLADLVLDAKPSPIIARIRAWLGW